MKKSPLLLNTVCAAAVVLLTACASRPEPTIADAQLPAVPQSFSQAEGKWTETAPAASAQRGAWWEAFEDTDLNRLVETANRRNTEVAVSVARLDAARAVIQATDAQRSLQVGASASAGRGNAQATAPAATSLTAGLSWSYELDLSGRLSRSVDAAAFDTWAAEAALQSTRLGVQARVVQTYFALKALDEEAAIVAQTLNAYRDTLRLTERRHLAGDVASLDVARVRSEVASTEAESHALQRQRYQLQTALAVLVGETASKFGLVSSPWVSQLPLIPAGLPSEVLARRPDVSAAQQRLAAAQARAGVANRAWFPSVVLTGNGGYASSDLNNLFQWSARSWGIGMLLSTPLLDGGRREAERRVAAARFDESLAIYREQLLQAFKDVEDQLNALNLLREQARAQAEAVTSAEEATRLSTSRYNNGLVSHLELLDAQRSELRNRRQALQVRTATFTATVSLIRAIGGSWDGAPGTRVVVRDDPSGHAR